MNKKIILITVIFLAIFFSGCLQFNEPNTDLIAYSEEITAQEKYCEADEDCEVVQLKCCSLFNPDFISVNKESAEKINQWKTENCSDCKIEGEPSRISLTILEDNSCEENKCQTNYVPYCKLISANCTADLTEQELNQLNMTKEEVLEACGC